MQEVTVSSTAKAMAAVRACESKRQDALFNDPFAERLAGEEAMAKAISLTEQHEKQGRPYAQVRTRFLDDFLLSNVKNISQVVLLGAGLDTRAFRLELPKQLRFFELDQEEIILYKNQILANDCPRCDRQTIATNLGESGWVDLLLNSGFNPSEPTIWILEGFLYYLTEEQAKILMTRINDLSAVGSVLGCDLINHATCNSSDDWAFMWQFGCDVPEDFFAEYGWNAKAVQPNEPEGAFGRFTFKFAPRENIEEIHIFFVKALKEEVII